MHDYNPPYSLSTRTVNLIAEIGERLGRHAALSEIERDVRLRRINRIRTITGSLAIEGNSLDEEQVTALLAGRRVLAPPREILEVRNAVEVYDRFDSWRPTIEDDLRAAHRIMMQGLVDDAGSYRRGGVGVFEGERVIHMAPPADRVPILMADLFDWLRR